MSLSVGIVGLPNVGKSTLFNALTKKQVEASNYPFCTIDPNVGVVKVPDERLDKIAEVSKPEKVIPTFVEFYDIAGLVKGANQGEGLGNQFLSHIRECDAICEVIREFKSSNIIHVDGKIDPKNDKEVIDTELMLADLATVIKRLGKETKTSRSGDKEAVKTRDVLEKIKNNLEEGVPVRSVELEKEEKKIIKTLNLLTDKPIIYILNIDDSNSGEIEGLENVVKLNAKQEQEIASLGEEEQEEFIKELGLERSGLDRLIKACYDLLGLITFFTTGKDETRAWTVTRGSSAPEAGGKIHTDIKEGFIRAEVVAWQDFIDARGEALAREKGLIKTEGKDYIIKDGDICHFLHNK
ncbi:redox-regulated ATPase YchF [bacterium]|nr:redox-regulated ATPase YchF [bacterium]